MENSVYVRFTADEVVDKEMDLGIAEDIKAQFTERHKSVGVLSNKEYFFISFDPDAEEGAYLYQGFNREITKEEFEQRISDNTLEEVLHKEHVKNGDVFLITPGTLHAIGGGILLAEVQQSSNVTYRIYDYGRVGSDARPGLFISSRRWMLLSL